MAYVLSPKLCHAFIGYLEEEAVKTYTHVIADLDKGRLPEWETKKVITCKQIAPLTFSAYLVYLASQAFPSLLAQPESGSADCTNLLM